MRKRPIGQILVEKNEISEAELAAALAEQERTGLRLGQILIETGRISWLAVAPAPMPVPAPAPVAPAPAPVAPQLIHDPEIKLHSVEALLRERQRAFIELVTTTETLRMKVAHLEEIIEERDRELTKLRVSRAS
jgi:hypothetical protein